jgi:hypothetical protein
MRDKSIHSSEKMLHKDYDRKGRESQGACGAKTNWLAVNRES